MILIKRASTNKVVLTLNELMTISSCDFLFSVKNDTTGDIQVFSSVDISTATNRYNEFSVIEPTDFVGIHCGYHTYTIYEMSPASPPDLDPANALSILEIGKLLVIDNAVIPSDDVEFDVDDAKDNVVFDI